MYDDNADGPSAIGVGATAPGSATADPPAGAAGSTLTTIGSGVIGSGMIGLETIGSGIAGSGIAGLGSTTDSPGHNIAGSR